jgi:ribonuclease R
MQKKKMGKPQNNQPCNLATVEVELVAFLQQNTGQTFSTKQIFKLFKINERKIKLEIAALLESLAERGIISRFDGKFTAHVEPEILEGVVDYVNPRFAYIVIPERETDVIVQTKNLKQALDGDTVKVAIFPTSGNKKAEGEVIEIVKRYRTEFVGRIEISNRFSFVVIDHKKMHFDIFVSNSEILNAKQGEKVVVQLVRWNEKDRNPIGKVIKVLGKAGENETEIHSILAEYGLPVEFPEEVEKEAENIATEIPEEEIKKRRDFRNVTTFTIDPVNAKDFDDALSLQKLSNGNWEVGVHIADVSHYVTPNTAIEKEGYQRATSVYLVDRVVPMLPEKLSNNLCSLRPNEDKLTFSAVFELDEQSNIVNEWFGKTIIHSNRRFSYEEAQERIETNTGDFADEINTLNRLAKILQDRRFASGAISFESTEFYFELDEQARPIRMVPKIRKDAHKLIEEFMLLANRRVAEFIFNKNKDKTKPPLTMVYRIHEDPNPEKIAQFAYFVKRFGIQFNTEATNIAAEFNSLSKKLEGNASQGIIESQAIRTMAKARYTTEPIGHYGLAFKHYSHFTSPIRRYPDLMTHRLIFSYLNGGESADKKEYEAKCKHSSEMEKRAADAERASIKYKQVEFMQTYIGREMQGIISGVTDWGMYVELEETKCEGMVRLANITDDRYYYDEKEMCVIGMKRKRRFQLGDHVTVIVRGTDLNRRSIDFDLVN